MEQWLARESHNLKVGGSSPPPATKWVCRNQGDRVTGGDPVAHTSSSLVRSTNKWCLTCRCISTVEQLICNQQVVGSKPSTGSNLFNGRVVEVAYNAGLSRRWSGFESPYARQWKPRRFQQTLISTKLVICIAKTNSLLVKVP